MSNRVIVSKADDLTARVMVWCQRMKAEGDEDVAGMLASLELRKRKGECKRRRKQAPNAVLSDPLTGRAIAGSSFYFEEKGRA